MSKELVGTIRFEDLVSQDAVYVLVYVARAIQGYQSALELVVTIEHGGDISLPLSLKDLPVLQRALIQAIGWAPRTAPSVPQSLALVTFGPYLEELSSPWSKLRSQIQLTCCEGHIRCRLELTGIEDEENDLEFSFGADSGRELLEVL